MQLLVFSLKPMTAEKKAQGLVGDKYEKARICHSAAVSQQDSHKTLVYESFWLHHLAQRENVSMRLVPTTHQKADILTKDLTAYAHEFARQGLRLQICNGL